MLNNWTFSTSQDEAGTFHIYRNGCRIGSRMGYETRKQAFQAIDETKRWDRIVDGPDTSS